MSLTPSLATLTAAPAEVQIGPKTYTLQPLTLRDMGEFEAWAQARVARCPLDGETEQQTAARAARVHFYSPECLALQHTMEGMGRLILISARHRHPGVTLDDLHAGGLSGLLEAVKLQRRLDAPAGPGILADPPTAASPTP